MIGRVGCLLVFGCGLFAQGGPLADHAERGEWGKVEGLLKGKVDVEEAQADGMTALLWAARRDEMAGVQALLAAGADAKARNDYGVTALSLACENGNGEMVRALLEAGAEVNARLEGGETVLVTAARTGRVECVRALLEAGAEVNAKERKGQTALMWAAAEGNLEVVEALLAAGAEFKAPLKSGFTPFFFAVRQGHGAVVFALLKAGVDVHGVAKPEKANAKTLRTGMSGLLLAVENGHLELALELIEAGADPTDARSGLTPLHMVVGLRKAPKGDGADGIPEPEGTGSVGSLEFVREIVKRGAKVDPRLGSGEGGGGNLALKGCTPFLLAAHTDDLPLVKLLVELGADPGATNARGTTALMAAAGVGVTAPGEEAGTEEEALETVGYLLDLGADINAVDDRGETAMHGAAYKAVTKVIALLDERGADISVWNQKNKSGWTPLAIGRGYRFGNFRPIKKTEEVIEGLMMKYGVKVPDPLEGR